MNFNTSSSGTIEEIKEDMTAKTVEGNQTDDP